MTETVNNTLDLARSFDIDFVGSPIVGEDEIASTFTVTETLEILTTNSLADNINIRYNTL
jgi:hypothetical protein